MPLKWCLFNRKTAFNGQRCLLIDFSDVHFLLTVRLALKPQCDMKLYKSLFSELREPPVSPGEPRILNKVADPTT